MSMLMSPFVPLDSARLGSSGMGTALVRHSTSAVSPLPTASSTGVLSYLHQCHNGHPFYTGGAWIHPYTYPFTGRQT